MCYGIGQPPYLTENYNIFPDLLEVCTFSYATNIFSFGKIKISSPAEKVRLHATEAKAASPANRSVWIRELSFFYFGTCASCVWNNVWGECCNMYRCVYADKRKTDWNQMPLYNFLFGTKICWSFFEGQALTLIVLDILLWIFLFTNWVNNSIEFISRVVLYHNMIMLMIILFEYEIFGEHLSMVKNIIWNTFVCNL